MKFDVTPGGGGISGWLEETCDCSGVNCDAVSDDMAKWGLMIWLERKGYFGGKEG